MLITADLQSQKGSLPKCCPPMSNLTSPDGQHDQKCPRLSKGWGKEQVRGHSADLVQKAV
jgi:hypothetical protein